MPSSTQRRKLRSWSWPTACLRPLPRHVFPVTDHEAVNLMHVQLDLQALLSGLSERVSSIQT